MAQGTRVNTRDDDAGVLYGWVGLDWKQIDALQIDT